MRCSKACFCCSPHQLIQRHKTQAGASQYPGFGYSYRLAQASTLAPATKHRLAQASTSASATTHRLAQASTSASVTATGWRKPAPPALATITGWRKPAPWLRPQNTGWCKPAPGFRVFDHSRSGKGGSLTQPKWGQPTLGSAACHPSPAGLTDPSIL